MNYIYLLRLLQKFASFVLLALYATNAHSIVKVQNVAAQKAHVDQVTTDIAARAHSDVQVRKLLKMFAEKKMDTPALYERLREIKSNK